MSSTTADRAKVKYGLVPKSFDRKPRKEKNLFLLFNFQIQVFANNNYPIHEKQSCLLSLK